MFELPELFPFLQAVYESAKRAEFVVDKSTYREAANTGEGWNNANLRTKFIKLLRSTGVSTQPRRFHTLRASRQT